MTTQSYVTATVRHMHRLHHHPQQLESSKHFTARLTQLIDFIKLKFLILSHRTQMEAKGSDDAIGNEGRNDERV